MKMTLPRFGSDEVEIDPNTLIEFPNGLPGFEGCKHFKLFHSVASVDSPVIFWLQSIDDPLVVFSLTDPEFLQIFYEMTLTDEELSTLQVESDDELQIAVTLARQEESNITVQSAIIANFRSPIIINVSKRIAIQKSLHNSESSIRTYQPLPEVQQDPILSTTGLHESSRMRSVVSESLCSFA